MLAQFAGAGELQDAALALALVVERGLQLARGDRQSLRLGPRGGQLRGEVSDGGGEGLLARVARRRGAGVGRRRRRRVPPGRLVGVLSSGQFDAGVVRAALGVGRAAEGIANYDARRAAVAGVRWSPRFA